MLTPREKELTDKIWKLECDKLSLYEKYCEDRNALMAELDKLKAELNVELVKSGLTQSIATP